MRTNAFNVAELAKEKGNVAFRSEDYETARSLYTHAMMIDPSTYAYPLNRSLANLKLDRWEDAEADSTKALELSPLNVKAFVRRGWARRQLGQYSQARSDIQMFLDHGGDPKTAAEEFKAITDVEKSPLPTVPSRSLETVLGALQLTAGLTSTSGFIIRSSEAVPKEQGAYASQDFKRGDMILSEKPIFSIPINLSEIAKYKFVQDEVCKLSPTYLSSYLSLQNSHIDCSCYPNIAIGIFATNSFALRDDDVGVCLKSSRFNHSCSPNARYSFNPRTKDLRVHALGTIRAGEEIFVMYISGRNVYGTPRKTRQTVLRARYHFTCACVSCSLSDEEAARSDARRMKLTKLWNSIPAFSPTQGRQRLNVIVEGVNLLKEEGFLADKDDFTNDAGIVCAYHSDWVSARFWAELTYRTRVEEFGKDSSRAEEVRGTYMNPKSFPMAGLGPVRAFTDIRV